MSGAHYQSRNNAYRYAYDYPEYRDCQSDKDMLPYFDREGICNIRLIADHFPIKPDNAENSGKKNQKKQSDDKKCHGNIKRRI